MYSIDALQGFIVTSWCCYVEYNGEGKPKRAFGVSMLASFRAVVLTF